MRISEIGKGGYVERLVVNTPLKGVQVWHTFPQMFTGDKKV